MLQVFCGLAFSHLLLLIGTVGFGLFDTSGQSNRHILLAIITILLSCFVQVVLFTYLTVTEKLINQAVHLSKLDSQLLDNAKSLKKRMTRTLAIVVTANLFLVATGALQWRGATVVGQIVHILASFIGISVHAWAYYGQYELTVQNGALVKIVLSQHEGQSRAMKRVGHNKDGVARGTKT